MSSPEHVGEEGQVQNGVGGHFYLRLYSNWPRNVVDFGTCDNTPRLNRKQENQDGGLQTVNITDSHICQLLYIYILTDIYIYIYVSYYIATKFERLHHDFEVRQQLETTSVCFFFLVKSLHVVFGCTLSNTNK